MDVPSTPISTSAPTFQRSAITIGELVVDTSVQVTLEDARSEATQLFCELSEPQQRRLAEEAWQIGLRALGNAQAQARESKLADIGKTLLDDVESVLGRHVASQLSSVETAMNRYFDPQDGEVNRRVQAFLADDGMLNRVLSEQLTGEQSQLARTLAAQVGEHSELFKRLDPDHKGSVVQMFEERLGAVLVENQRAMSQALDPAAPDGALTRLLTSLRKEMEEAQRRGASQLQKAVAALDANDETSAIARLIKETGKTQQALLRAINIEALRDVDERIQSELKRIAKMRGEVAKIMRAGETLENELRIGEKKLGTLVEKAKSTLAALNVELHDREVEVANPIVAPEMAFESMADVQGAGRRATISG